MNEKIAIDIDEVLAATLPQVIRFHNENYGTDLSMSDFRFNRWYKAWGGDSEDELDKLEIFYDSEYFENVKPIKGAQRIVSELAQDYDLIVITARSDEIAQSTKDWIRCYFPNCFRDIFFCNHYTRSKKPVSKSKICSEQGVNYLVEDSLDYAHECVCPEMEVLLFDYPWNTSASLKEGVTRVHSWLDVANYFRMK